MRLLHVSLLCCCFVHAAFVNVEAKLDVATEFRKRLNAWALSRTKRDLKTASKSKTQVVSGGRLFVRTEDVKGNLNVHSSSDTHIRTKRYLHGLPHFPQFHLNRPSCQLGTCQVQKLSHRLNQLLNNPLKDDVARWSTWSPNSYGRKRRSLRTRIAAKLPRPQKTLTRT
ncbi:ADM precursor [Callorhinchus milii]|nr:adrenomedullin a precursor [Callorhinchus milii]AFK10723.1 adrenomedullin 1 [Callorhinchus milii]AFM85812.1 adrenomedullin 1 [Callorhinchus milii]AFM85825.1 adrenomedullin 1 [Callorhinchus milii]AFM90468.1 adrenomedullin 1 [Callorhinchus milii]|eukprot:gi/632941269/ref/XP_007885774.1/ PREDICTED: ADM [Callorhinchus milii]